MASSKQTRVDMEAGMMEKKEGSKRKAKGAERKFAASDDETESSEDPTQDEVTAEDTDVAAPVRVARKKKSPEVTSEERKARSGNRKRKQPSAMGAAPAEEGFWVSEANREQMNRTMCETMENTMAGLWLRYGTKRTKVEGQGRVRKEKKFLRLPDGKTLKKPPSAYLLWSKDERKVLKDEKICDSADTLSVLGERWGTKTDEEKKPYQQEAERLQAVYETQKENCEVVVKPESTRRPRGSGKKAADGSSPAKKKRSSKTAKSADKAISIDA